LVTADINLLPTVFSYTCQAQDVTNSFEPQALDFDLSIYSSFLPKARFNSSLSLGYYQVQEKDTEKLAASETRFPVLSIPSKTTFKVDVKLSSSQNSRLIQVDFSSSFVLCSEKFCPKDKGSCMLFRGIKGIVFAQCQCTYGYGGENCEQVVVSQSKRTAEVLMLALSNCAMFWAVWLAFSRKQYGLSLSLLLSSLTSLCYHVCDQQVYCTFALHYTTWQKMDFFCSYMIIFAVAAYLSYIPIALQGTAMTGFGFIGAIMALQDAPNSMFIVLGFSVFSVVSTSSILILSQFNKLTGPDYRKRAVTAIKHFYKDWNILALIMAAFFLGAASFCFSTQINQNYWIKHGMWHITVMLCVAFLILSRTNQKQIIPEQESQDTSNHATPAGHIIHISVSPTNAEIVPRSVIPIAEDFAAPDGMQSVVIANNQTIPNCRRRYSCNV